MTFTDTAVAGMFVIEGDLHADARGSLEVAWQREVLARRGLETAVAQGSVAVNHRRGTLRGLHYQAAPFEEVKIVRVVRGAAFDVALDLRPDSPTYRRWFGVELSADNGRMVYLPRGVAHGYQTLADDTVVFYLVSTPYEPGHQRGVRWNDPAFGIAWPIDRPTAISERDATFPDYRA
ncbi:MAG TPA: dTDP-4-dehydrorhamnose 3,5-epimerase family protein [Vicinamibacterales bacterium]|nr:dTDP-4-dehydrorhamnose 3,5-epimerase family protein [Vicinamibacterales bacterium]